MLKIGGFNRYKIFFKEEQCYDFAIKKCEDWLINHRSFNQENILKILKKENDKKLLINYLKDCCKFDIEIIKTEIEGHPLS